MENSRKKIVMVDDDPSILIIGRNTLIDDYDIFTIPSGEKLFNFLEKVIPDLILLDIEMPVINGYEIIKILKNKEDLAQIPVIFLTAMADAGNELEGLSLGAIDYITKPFSPSLLLKRIEVHMLVESQKRELKHHNDNLEQIVREKTQAILELQNAILKTIAELVECRDDVTGGHIERTQGYLKLMINCLIEDEIYREEVLSWDIDFFILSALLHDVGKIAIKDNILLKPGRLTTEEFEEMKTHAALGVKIIQKIKQSTRENAFLSYAEILAGSHHEKWDGSGYPLGFSGANIPLQGRVMAIIDVYDALTNSRPYKKAMSHKDAIEVIKNESGTHFDPHLVRIFIEHEKEFENLEVMIHDFSNITKENEEAVYGLRNMVSKTVSEIVNYRDGAVSNIDTAHNYIKIFLDALKKCEKYREIVESWDLDILLLSARIHDIGKVIVRDDILQKPSKLTHEEFGEVKTHINSSVRVIKKIQEHVNIDTNDFLKHEETIAGSHHEKWNGTGYPMGLRGDRIPLQSRVMAIIDVYDALINFRPYKEAMTHEEAIELIREKSGTHFDPELVKIFLEHEREFKNAYSILVK